MMICKADFDELFPGLLDAEERDAPSLACALRWEDDGGRPYPAPAPRQRCEAAPAPKRDENLPFQAGLAWAMVPALGAWTMLSAFDTMPRG